MRYVLISISKWYHDLSRCIKYTKLNTDNGEVSKSRVCTQVSDRGQESVDLSRIDIKDFNPH